MDATQQSPFHQLPADVIVRLASHLDLTEKANLLMTCQYLRKLLEPTIYEHLMPNDYWKTRRRVRLYRTLEERPDLLPHIHSLQGLIIPTLVSGPYERVIRAGSREDEIQTQIRNDWINFSAPLLAQAINIRDLEFTDNLGWKLDNRWEAFKNIVSNMKLYRLVFNSASDGQLDFTPVLRGQTELTQFVLVCEEATFEDLEDTAVPRLKIFKGTLLQAAAIVPGRPVETLGLKCPYLEPHRCHCLEEDIYRKLLQSSGTIETLELQPHHNHHEDILRGVLQLATQHFPSIVDLTIIAEPEPLVKAQLLIEEIPKFPLIRRLTLFNLKLVYPTPPPLQLLCIRFKLGGVRNFKGLLKKLTGICPSLKEVRQTTEDDDPRGKFKTWSAC
ncbi:hypothetical protein FRC01_005362 [Tulasnella sp. 417]|nr:hypothetical protein FRC01_005362 [Tulasnella sp. 417]